MITGVHLLFYSTDPDADRAFIRDVLGFRSVELGAGWLIFAFVLSRTVIFDSCLMRQYHVSSARRAVV